MFPLERTLLIDTGSGVAGGPSPTLVGSTTGREASIHPAGLPASSGLSLSGTGPCPQHAPHKSLLPGKLERVLRTFYFFLDGNPLGVNSRHDSLSDSFL